MEKEAPQVPLVQRAEGESPERPVARDLLE